MKQVSTPTQHVFAIAGQAFVIARRQPLSPFPSPGGHVDPSAKDTPPLREPHTEGYQGMCVLSDTEVDQVSSYRTAPGLDAATVTERVLDTMKSAQPKF